MLKIITPILSTFFFASSLLCMEHELVMLDDQSEEQKPVAGQDDQVAAIAAEQSEEEEEAEQDVQAVIIYGAAQTGNLVYQDLANLQTTITTLTAQVNANVPNRIPFQQPAVPRQTLPLGIPLIYAARNVKDLFAQSDPGAADLKLSRKYFSLIPCIDRLYSALVKNLHAEVIEIVRFSRTPMNAVQAAQLIARRDAAQNKYALLDNDVQGLCNQTAVSLGDITPAQDGLLAKLVEIHHLLQPLYQQ